FGTQPPLAGSHFIRLFCCVPFGNGIVVLGCVVSVFGLLVVLSGGAATVFGGWTDVLVSRGALACAAELFCGVEAAGFVEAAAGAATATGWRLFSRAATAVAVPVSVTVPCSFSM